MTRDGQAGLTLIEVLVVLAVIGVGAGATMMGMGGADRSSAAQTEARRLARTLTLGVDEALITGLPLALLWDGSGYRFIGMTPGDRGGELGGDAAGGMAGDAAGDAAGDMGGDMGGPDGWPAALPGVLGLRHDLAAPLELRIAGAVTPQPVILPASGATPAVTFQIVGRGVPWVVVFDGFTATAQAGGGL